MSDERNSAGSRPIELAGDSPELIAFGLLRYLAQLEQQNDSMQFDRDWLLDAYTDCLDAVNGRRVKRPAPKKEPLPKPGSPSGRSRKR